MASQVMRITLKAYDHQLVDASAKKIIETVKEKWITQVSRTGSASDKKEVVTISEPFTNTKIPESSSSKELTKD